MPVSFVQALDARHFRVQADGQWQGGITCGQKVVICEDCKTVGVLSQKRTISSWGDIRVADMDPWSVMSVAADTKARPIRRPSSLDVTSCSSAPQYCL